MPDHSFDIASAKAFYAQLLAEYEDFKQDRVSSRRAINCALWSWHLCEWLYVDHEVQLTGQFRDQYEFRSWLVSQCPSLCIMEDIANGSKHCRRDRSTNTQGSTLRRGAFSSGFSRDFVITRLMITMADGSERCYDDVLDEVMSFFALYPQLH